MGESVVADTQREATSTNAGTAEAEAPTFDDTRSVFGSSGRIPPTKTSFSSPPPTASEQAYGHDPKPTPSHRDSPLESIGRGKESYEVASKAANAAIQTLAPAYLAARDQLDANAVAELGGHLIGAFDLVHGAHMALSQLRLKRVRQDVLGSDAGESLEISDQQQDLDQKAASLDALIEMSDHAIVDALTPHRFRGVSIGDVGRLELAGSADAQNAHLMVELRKTIGMLSLAHELHTTFADGNHPGQAVVEGARMRLGEWTSRPLDIAFLHAALGPVWALLDGGPNATSTKPSDMLSAADKQAKGTGWLGDVGRFDLNSATNMLHAGGRDMAENVLADLYSADAPTRGYLLMQLRERAVLDRLCSAVGWADVKQLHDSFIGFPELKHVMQPYFTGRGKYGPTPDSEWENHDSSISGTLNRDLGVVGRGLNFALDLATFGFNSSYGQARDRRTEGITSEAEANREKTNAALRTAAIAIASTVTGGMAFKVAGGTGVVADVAAGSAGAVGGQLGSDAYNNVVGVQHGLSSPQQYVEAALLGGAGGAALGGLLKFSGAARRYVPGVPDAGNDAVGMDANETATESPTASEAAQTKTTPEQAKIEHEPPPSREQIQEMEEASVGESLKLAKQFVKNPNTVYHHYLTKGGLRHIAQSSVFNGGDGTASFGGVRSVRAWIGDAMPGASVNAGTPLIEFTTTAGEVPNVRLFQSRPGAYWDVDAMPVNIKSIQFPNGATAVPDGPGFFRVTDVDGHVSRLSAQELPE